MNPPLKQEKCPSFCENNKPKKGDVAEVDGMGHEI
jgi:hypothetical protein